MNTFTLEPYKRTASDIKIIRLMRSLNGRKDLVYPSQSISGTEENELNQMDCLENITKKAFLLKDIKALADVARSKNFTSDSSDRELISDIFTEIFIKTSQIETIEDYGVDISKKINDTPRLDTEISQFAEAASKPQRAARAFPNYMEDYQAIIEAIEDCPSLEVNEKDEGVDYLLNLQRINFLAHIASTKELPSDQASVIFRKIYELTIKIMN